MRSTLGTGLGGLCHVVGAALGLSTLLMTSATAFEVVRYAGALLPRLPRRPHAARPARARRRDAAARPRRQRLAPGRHAELLNPKTALFFLTFLPQFAQPERGPVALQLLALGTVSVALNSSADLVVATLGGRARSGLRTGRVGSAASGRCRASRSSRSAATRPRRTAVRSAGGGTLAHADRGEAGRRGGAPDRRPDVSGRSPLGRSARALDRGVQGGAGKGSFPLTAKTRIYVDSASKATADILAKDLRPATGYPLKVSGNRPARACPAAFC